MDIVKYTFYKIYNKNDIKNCYIGSTKNYKKRITQHKKDSNNKLFKLYNYINENGGWDNFNCIIIDEKEFCNKVDRYRHEGKLQKLINSNLNQCIAGRTKKEYNKYYNTLKYHCDICDCVFLRKNLARHFNSMKHLKNSNQNQE